MKLSALNSDYRTDSKLAFFFLTLPLHLLYVSRSDFQKNIVELLTIHEIQVQKTFSLKTSCQFLTPVIMNFCVHLKECHKFES